MRPRAPEEFRLPTQLTDQPSICSWTPLLPHKYLYQEGSTSVGLFRNPCLPASLIQRSDTCLASMCLRSCFNTYNHKGAELSGSTKNDQTTNFIPALGPHTEKTRRSRHGFKSTAEVSFRADSQKAGDTTVAVSGVQNGVCKHLRTVYGQDGGARGG